jgi:hypothetical protein
VTKVKQESINEIPVQIAVVRFDKIFFETPPDQLHKIKRIPVFFPEGNDDAVWIERCKIHCGRELYDEVQKNMLM